MVSLEIPRHPARLVLRLTRALFQLSNPRQHPGNGAFRGSCHATRRIRQSYHGKLGSYTRMTLPTRQEINPFDDLDGRVACEHFVGKSLDEAESLFRENDIYYQSDLMWMGAPAFRFYLPAVVRFVRRETGDISDFIAHFTGTLEFRLEHEADELMPVASQLADFCVYVIEHWAGFSEGAERYGDVRVRLETLRETFSRLCQETERL